MKRFARQVPVKQAEADFDPLPFDAEAARRSAVWPLLYAVGQKTAARAYDAMIAPWRGKRACRSTPVLPSGFAGSEGCRLWRPARDVRD